MYTAHIWGCCSKTKSIFEKNNSLGYIFNTNYTFLKKRQHTQWLIKKSCLVILAKNIKKTQPPLVEKISKGALLNFILTPESAFTDNFGLGKCFKYIGCIFYTHLQLNCPVHYFLLIRESVSNFHLHRSIS